VIFDQGYSRDQTCHDGYWRIDSTGNCFAGLYGQHWYSSRTNVRLEDKMGGHFMTQSLKRRWQLEKIWQNKKFFSAEHFSNSIGRCHVCLDSAQACKYLNRSISRLADKSNFFNCGMKFLGGTIGQCKHIRRYVFWNQNAAGVLQVPLILSVWDDE